MIRIAGIGGGTGLAAVLSGLRQAADADETGRSSRTMQVSAVVSVADNGGSSGVLRRALGMPAVGDLRSCVVASCEPGDPLALLFRHRFPSVDGLEGHSLGNLILAALYQDSGSLGEAVKRAGALLHAGASVFPVTEASVTLCAQFEDGTTARGEAQIPAAGKPIQRIWLEPGGATPYGEALQAISTAEMIVLGPGSLYTSVLPNLLVPGIAAAIRQSRALKVFVCNLMTQPGETDGFSAADHVRVIETYLGEGSVDVCLANSASPRPDLLETYHAAGCRPVAADAEELARMGKGALIVELLSEAAPIIRHDSVKLGLSLLALGGAASRQSSVGNPNNALKRSIKEALVIQGLAIEMKKRALRRRVRG